MTLSEIEAVIGISEMEFRERVLTEMMEVQEEQVLRCEQCGGSLRNKGQRQKRIVALRGELAGEGSLSSKKSYINLPKTCKSGRIFAPDSPLAYSFHIGEEVRG